MACRYAYFQEQMMGQQPSRILTDREKEILQLSVNGLSNMEIGETLFIDGNKSSFTRRSFSKNATHKKHHYPNADVSCHNG